MAKWKTLKRRAQRKRAKQRPRSSEELTFVERLLRDIYAPALLEQFKNDFVLMRIINDDAPKRVSGSYFTVPFSSLPGGKCQTS